MTELPKYFARLNGHVDFPLMQGSRVAVVGVGMVGSQIALALANCAVGYLRLIDHDVFAVENAFRHALPAQYVRWNKATALADYLSKQVDSLEVEPIAREVKENTPSELLERWLSGVDLIVAATDRREAQRLVGQQALRLGIPAIFPALYLDGRGEIVVQTDTEDPCFGCWDYARTNTEPLREVTGLPMAAMPVIYTTIRLCLGILDPTSPDSDLMRDDLRSQPRQFFRLNRSGTLEGGILRWREGCPSCGGGAERTTVEPIWMEPLSIFMLPDDDEERWREFPGGSERDRSWQERSFGIRTVPTGSITSGHHTPSPAQQQEPTPGSPLYHAVPATPPPPLRQRQVSTSSPLWARVGFLVSPIGIMALVIPAKNAHPSAFLDVMSVICFFWLIAGIAGLFIEW